MRAAEAAVSAVRRAGVTPDVVMLTAMMRAHLENGNVPEAWRQWTLLERHGMVPDAAAYATAIAACGAGGELERAENIFEQYQQTGLPPNRRVFHELMRACGRRMVELFLPPGLHAAPALAVPETTAYRKYKNSHLYSVALIAPEMWCAAASMLA